MRSHQSHQSRQSHAIDQIVFNWARSTLIGNGYGPVVSSLEEAELRQWDQLLRGRLRSEDKHRPDTSLCYVHLHGRAVILHRSRSGELDNRHDVCHVLIGSPTVLDVWAALRLPGWSGWRRDAVATDFKLLPKLDMGCLPRPGTDGELSRRLAGPQRPLTILLDAVLREPSAPLSIVADDELRVPLLVGLFEILAQFEQSAANGQRAPRTFSTYEVDLETIRSDRPHFAFVPDEAAVGGADRGLVVLTDELSGDAVSDVAQTVAELYLRGGPKQISDWLDTAGVLRQDMALPERIRALAGLTPVTSGQGSYPGVSAEVSAPVQRSASVSVPNGDHRSVPSQPRPRISTGSTDPRTMSWLDLLNEFGRAGSANRQREILQVIKQRKTIEDPVQRLEARRLLAANDFWVRRMWGVLPQRELRTAVIVTFNSAFGYELLERSHTWEFLGDLSTPPLATQLIVEYAVENGLHDQLAPALGRRWMREHGLPVGDPMQESAHPPIIPPKPSGLAGVVERWTGGNTLRALVAGAIAGAVAATAAVLALMAVYWTR